MTSFFKKNQNNDQAGFSLVELLVVIAILLVITSFSYSGFHVLLPKFRVNAAARTMRSDIVNAKSRAMRDMRQYRIAFVTNGYQLQQGNARTGSTVWTGVIPFPINEDFSDYTGVSLNVGASIEPVFSPNGTVQQNITIVLDHDKGRSRTLRISLPGRIRIE